MKVSYFPGCTLKTHAKDLDEFARKSAQILGIELEELPEWQCCGGVFTTASDEIATKLSSIRALDAAKKLGQPLVTVCSACHNVLKQTNEQYNRDPEFQRKVKAYMGPEFDYDGSTEVLHFLELLRDKVGFDRLKEQVKTPLTGVRIAPYYGCLLLRPTKVMQMDDPENPVILENFLKALGAEPVYYAYRNECCGGYTSIEDPAQSKKQSEKVFRNAEAEGAEMMVTACPLCKYNLVKNGAEIPVKYFTELLAKALGVEA